jgi:hypothetical protein
VPIRIRNKVRSGSGKNNYGSTTLVDRYSKARWQGGGMRKNGRKKKMKKLNNLHSTVTCNITGER